MNKIKNIFGTGTMRSGGSLTSQIFSLNNKVQMFMETLVAQKQLWGNGSVKADPEEKK